MRGTKEAFSVYQDRYRERYRHINTDHDFEGITPRVQSLTAEMNRDGSRILLPLLGAAALVLLIACGNAAALLLVRGLQRQQEYAVRTALGVRRVALFRQVSTESLLLALLGGAFGAGLAFAVVKLFKLIGGHAIPRLARCRYDRLACACLWTRLGGLGRASGRALPRPRASLLDPMEVLKSAGPESNYDQPVQSAIRLQHRTYLDDECAGREGGLVCLSSSGVGARISASRSAACRFRVGCSSDRQ